ncbi:Rab family protein [Fulvitalea axinellae]|uniref:non-specific serine/threonine protein kinase n=1 Tax=Fulvitalea axinellae TaxID=1182444 RepID=A0AAU9CZX5_9BACT|nr:Rab family protein [Fulvitalea axinellae]
MEQLEAIRKIEEVIGVKAVEVPIEEETLLTEGCFFYSLNDRKHINKIIISPPRFKNFVSPIDYIDDFSESLQSLTLYHCKIEKLDSIQSFIRLQTLKLPANSIKDLTPLQSLKKIKTLDLSYNSISDLTPLRYLHQIQDLNLFNNLIKDLTPIQYLEQIQKLDLGSNYIEDLTPIQNLKQVQKLHLISNSIQELEPLQNLKLIQKLFLSHNNINDLTPIQNLNNIKVLDLKNNSIEDLTVIQNLQQIQVLDLSDNSIKEFDFSLFNVGLPISFDGWGETICLRDNPIESPPIEIIKQGKEACLRWLEANKKKLDEVKIILIGDPKAGKTSLLRRLNHNEFDENEAQTDGINIEGIKFGDCNCFAGQKNLHGLTGYFWDFGGQEIMNATHQFFLTKRSVYVLVIDARKDKDTASHIREWVRRIKTTGGNSSVIVVANQIDVHTGFGFENQHELQKEFPQIKYFLRVSCKTEEGLEELKEKLAELVPQAELFNTEIDERWIEIKDEFRKETTGEGEKKGYLNESIALEICSDKGLDDDIEQKEAIRFLHDLGIVLHFEAARLEDYFVLNPYWVTYGVYQILTSKKAGELKGLVPFSELKYIINKESDKATTYKVSNYKKIEYGPNERMFLIEILKKFKLCFELKGEEKLIIPELLETAEPKEKTSPIREAVDKIQFVYEYEHLPSSIFPHIMVSAHDSGYLREQWRSGCILENDGVQALLIKYNGRITITVTGERNRKRDFMAVIIALVDAVNNELSDKPEQMIPLPGTDDYAKYKVLLRREKKGKREYIWHEDEDDEKVFEISELLTGMPREDNLKKILNEVREIKSDVKDVKCSLDRQFDYLLALPGNQDIREILNEEVGRLNEKQTEDLCSTLFELLNGEFSTQRQELSEQLETIESGLHAKVKQTLEELNKSKDFQLKLKFGIPLGNLLGLNMEGEVDLLSVVDKIYKRKKNVLI